MPYLNKLDDFCWTMQITPYELARKIGRTPNSLYSMLREPTAVAVETLGLIADAYDGLPSNYLIEWVHPDEVKQKVKEKLKLYKERKVARYKQK